MTAYFQPNIPVRPNLTFLKDLLLTLLLIVSAFVLGFAVDYKYTLVTKGLGSAGNLVGGPVVSISKMVVGKAIKVEGKSMTVEAGGQKINVQMALEVNITAQTLPSSTPGSEGTPSAAVAPKTFRDFGIIPVGNQVTVFMEMQPNGDFVAKSVFLILPSAKAK
ncbi:MAG: hypothetical protein M1352_02310 [Patescibacteria group bacterium]|nr:hypothetical protein [Patescibacteria group bacterium]